ncbi:MAG: hypothetical protein MI784_15230 [Cytophagales bacterium]|nr:hypothetical protein [Cytophagales bacterium]
MKKNAIFFAGLLFWAGLTFSNCSTGGLSEETDKEVTKPKTEKETGTDNEESSGTEVLKKMEGLETVKTVDWGTKYPKSYLYELKYVNLKNKSTKPITISKFWYEGEHKKAFKVKGAPATLKPGADLNLSVTFYPPTVSSLKLSPYLVLQSSDKDTLKIQLKANTSLEYKEGTIAYVDHKAKGKNDGTSWENAFTDLAEALKILGSRGADLKEAEVWVAKGTYQAPEKGFFMSNPIGVYGGFTGAETKREQRDWAANRTVLTGGGRSHHVLSIIPPMSPWDKVVRDLVVDGFDVVEGASLKPLNDYYYGAGVLMGNIKRTSIRLVHIKLNNLRIYNNRSATGSAAIYANHSPATLTNCIITKNRGRVDSGGSQSEIDRLYSGKVGGIISCGSNESSPAIVRFINCTIAGNGLGERAEAGHPTVSFNKKAQFVNCIIWGENDLVSNNGKPQLTNCIVKGGGSYPSNIGADPQFAGDILDGQLKSSSPAMNAGKTGVLPDNITKDINGRPRINGTIDIGATEQ